MRHTTLCCLTLLYFAGCNSETPIGTVNTDADPLASPGDTLDQATADGQGAQDVPKSPPSGPPNQALATRNADGTYSCTQFDGDPYAGCPTVALNGQLCDLPAGTICDIPDQNGNGTSICSCESVGSHNVLACVGVSGPRPDCPTAIPEHGSPCTVEQRGLGCGEYIKPLACTCEGDLPNREKERFVSCTCDNDAQVWLCTSVAAPREAPFDLAFCRHPDAPQLPAGPDIAGSKVLTELTDTEIASFCDWAVETQRAGGEPPLPEPPVVNGTWGSGFASTTCLNPVQFCLPRLPADICAQLIKRKPCGVTVQQVTECLLTGMRDCNVVGTGCGPLNVDPNCSETIVQLASSMRPAGVEDCAVPLD